MDFKMILYLLLATILICIIVFCLVVFFVIKPYLDRKNEIRYMEAIHRRNEIFMNLSPEAMIESVDKYMKSYVNRYILYKFISKKINYIKQEDVDKMIKDITISITSDISELYIFYISMIRDINTDDDLILFINNRIKNICVEEVMNYNSQMQ